jgi:hypothetical protein
VTGITFSEKPTDRRKGLDLDPCLQVIAGTIKTLKGNAQDDNTTKVDLSCNNMASSSKKALTAGAMLGSRNDRSTSTTRVEDEEYWVSNDLPLPTRIQVLKNRRKKRNHPWDQVPPWPRRPPQAENESETTPSSTRRSQRRMAPFSSAKQTPLSTLTSDSDGTLPPGAVAVSPNTNECTIGATAGLIGLPLASPTPSDLTYSASSQSTATPSLAIATEIAATNESSPELLFEQEARRYAILRDAVQAELVVEITNETNITSTPTRESASNSGLFPRIKKRLGWGLIVLGIVIIAVVMGVVGGGNQNARSVSGVDSAGNYGSGGDPAVLLTRSLTEEPPLAPI